MKATLYHPSMHLNLDQMYQVKGDCPICKRNTGFLESVVIQEEPEVKLMNCRFCQGSFASYMPYQNVLDEYYKNYYTEGSSSITFHNAKVFAKHILEKINLSGRDNVSILDYGGGDGAIAIEIAHFIKEEHREVTVSVTVVDYEEPSVENTDEIEVQSYKELKDVLESSYDLVLASAILEHVPNMYEVITNLFSLVGEKGYFYARTPYMEPLMKLSSKVDMTFPAHIYDLGGNFWNNIALTYGLNIKTVYSRPSIVETSFSQSFSRALVAHVLKVPGHIESKLFPKRKQLYWKWVGGWEVCLFFR